MDEKIIQIVVGGKDIDGEDIIYGLSDKGKLYLKIRKGEKYVWVIII